LGKLIGIELKKLEKELNACESKIYRLAEPYLKVRGNDIHTQSALRFAFSLLKREMGNRAIVIPGVILHDVGWSKVPKDVTIKALGPRGDHYLTKIHEIEGMRISLIILRDIGYDSSLIPEILYIISGHDTRTYAESINEKIVRDADKLSRYTKELFWFFVEYLIITPYELYSYLEANLDKWFFLDISKEIARKELRRIRREIYPL
jgi:hypothetical protein